MDGNRHTRFYGPLIATAGLVALSAAPLPAHGANALTGEAIGVPPAHWSSDFSFGVRWSAPVRDLPREAFTKPHQVIHRSPDNGRGTRWHIRIRPGWSADAVIEIQASPTCNPGRTVCGAKGETLRESIRVQIPARP